MQKLTSKNLVRIRKEKGMTQKQLADVLGVFTTQISAWETGARGIGEKMMVRLCNALDCQPADFYATGEPKERRKAENTRKRLVIQEVLKAMEAKENSEQLSLVCKILSALGDNGPNGQKAA